jgi:site-specific recombinase XerD
MPKVTTVTPETIDQFLSSLHAKGRASNTLKAYGTDLRVFLAAAGTEIPVDQFEPRAMLWLTINRDTVSPKTTGRRLTSVRAYARWAQIPTPDLVEYSSPVTPRAVPHPLPEGIDGVRRLIEAARFEHHKALIALCGLAGLRVAESLTVEPTHINFSTMNLTVRGKGDVTRIVPVSEECWDVIASPVVRVATGGGPVVGLHDRFARRLVTDLGVRAGLSRRVKSHDLRATFATAVYNKTGDIRLVQMLLGHASVTTTQVYIETAMEALKEAVRL